MLAVWMARVSTEVCTTEGRRPDWASSLPPFAASSAPVAESPTSTNPVNRPFEELDKNALPSQICPFTFGVLRTEAAFAPGRYDLVHAHYWLSGQVGAVAAERWGVPLIQSMHTLGKVKNLALASGDCAEPAVRIRGEGEVVAAADRLVANTADEARQLIKLYGATPWRGRTGPPGGGPSGVPPPRSGTF